MKACISQSQSEGFSEITSEGPKGQQELPCAGCRTLNCHAIHGPVVLECYLEGCYACADLASIDYDIYTTYERLSNLVRERQEMMVKSRHDTFIHRLPVEILSSIFLAVKDNIIDFKFKEDPDNLFPRPPSQQPSQSPPLLVGAVCKQWREITLITPQLWTDIIVNLIKSAHGQSNMVTTWAQRAGALPLDLTIQLDLTFLERKRNKFISDKELLEEVEDVLSALKTVSAQWNNVTLCVPASVCYRLFSNLQETPLLGTLFFEVVHWSSATVKLQHPLRPKRLISNFISSKNIPFEWDRLVFVNLSRVDDREILHIIRDAQNLRYCIADASENNDFPLPTIPITNHSLIHLVVTCDIISCLTLPSLSYLDYKMRAESFDECFDDIAEFIDRSCASMDKFILRLDVLPDGPPPLFDKLPGITSLFLQKLYFAPRVLHNPSWPPDEFLQALNRPAILPHLEELSVSGFDFLQSSWILLTHLFRKDSNSAESDAVLDTSIAIKRPLSKVVLPYIYFEDTLTLNKEIFLRLLEVKKSGVNLIVEIDMLGDFFTYMAECYRIKL